MDEFGMPKVDNAEKAKRYDALVWKVGLIRSQLDSATKLGPSGDIAQTDACNLIRDFACHILMGPKDSSEIRAKAEGDFSVCVLLGFDAEGHGTHLSTNGTVESAIAIMDCIVREHRQKQGLQNP